MNNSSKHLILVVDDEKRVRETTTLVLQSAGYDVHTAEDGFDALMQLRNDPLPEVIISDLNMPQMSGFEFLSVVRRRFPEISIIAISGVYEAGDHVRGGIIADAFYAKGRHRPQELLRTIEELIRTTAEQAAHHRERSAPVWTPRNGKDPKGVPFIVLTCPQCLRSFPLSIPREDIQEIQETPCLFCSNPVRYIFDFSLDVKSPKAVRATGQDESVKGYAAG